MRRFSVIALLAIGLGCRPASEGPVTEVMRLPGSALDSLETVAFIGLAAATVENTAVPIMEAILETELLAAQRPFVVLSMEDVERRARVRGCADLLYDMRSFWRDEKKVDKLKLAQLCEQLVVQGILVGQILEWEAVRPAPGSGDEAFTRVSANLALYVPETGRAAWRARASYSMRPEQAVEDYRDARELTARDRERLKSVGAQNLARAPEPLPPEIVAQAVAAALSESLKP